jgi:hypothetical protein
LDLGIRQDWPRDFGGVDEAAIHGKWDGGRLAILDRFFQHAAIMNITGKSYRLRHGGKGETNAKPDSKGWPSAGNTAGSPHRKTAMP